MKFQLLIFVFLCSTSFLTAQKTIKESKKAQPDTDFKTYPKALITECLCYVESNNKDFIDINTKIVKMFNKSYPYKYKILPASMANKSVDEIKKEGCKYRLFVDYGLFQQVSTNGEIGDPNRTKSISERVAYAMITKNLETGKTYSDIAYMWKKTFITRFLSKTKEKQLLKKG